MAQRSIQVGVRCVIGLGTAAILLSGLTGCYSDISAQESQYIRWNPSPEVDDLHRREIDRDNMYAVTFDENMRQIWSDFDRVMLLDRPSRLSPETFPR